MEKKRKKVPAMKNGGMQNWTQEDIDKYNSLPTEELKRQFAENIAAAPLISGEVDTNIQIPSSLTSPKNRRLNSVLRDSSVTTDNVASAVKGAAVGVAANASNDKPIMQGDQKIVPTDILGTQKVATKAIGAIAGEETGKSANAFVAGSNDAVLKSVAAGNVDPISLAIAGIAGGISNVGKRKNYNKAIDKEITDQTNQLNETLSETARVGAVTGAYDKDYVTPISQTQINAEKKRIKGMSAQKLASGGEVVGPGTAKSDSVNTKLEPKSFVVPVENTPLAKALRKRFLGGSGKTLKAKDGNGVPVKLSKGEEVFTPEERQTLESKGVNVKALAPNADSSMRYAEGGDVKSKVEDLYKNRNVRAYLRFIAYAESRYKQDADNPESTAYGEFQFIDGTHKDIKAKYGYDARSKDPIEREKAAIALIIDNGAEKLVQDRNSWNAADKRLNGIWTSLPGGAEPQSGVTDKANEFRTRYLNDLANTDRDTGSITPIIPSNKPTVTKPKETVIAKPKTEIEPITDNKYLNAATYYSKRATENAQKELTAWAKKFGYGNLKLSDVNVGDFKMTRIKINGKELPVDPTVSAENKRLITALKRHVNGQTGLSEIKNMDGKKGGALLDPKEYTKTAYEKYFGDESTIDKIPKSLNAANDKTNVDTGASSEVSDFYQDLFNKKDTPDSTTTNSQSSASGSGAAGKIASPGDVARKIVPGPKSPVAKTAANTSAKKTEEAPPPSSTPQAPPSAFDKLQESGVTDTIFSAVQFAQGMKMTQGNRPKDSVPLEMRVRLADAMGDEATAQKEAMTGLDPVTKQMTLDNMELAKRTDFAEIDQSTGGTPLSEILKRVSSNNKYRAIASLASVNEQVRAQKDARADNLNARTDALAGGVSNYKRGLFEDEMKAFDQSQTAGAALINAGMANYFQNRSTAEQRKKDRALFEKYGITY